MDKSGYPSQHCCTVGQPVSGVVSAVGSGEAPPEGGLEGEHGLGLEGEHGLGLLDLRRGLPGHRTEKTADAAETDLQPAASRFAALRT